LTLILNQSCDPLFWAQIESKTQKDIDIELSFDKEFIESEWNKTPYKHPEIQNAIGQSNKIVSNDTLNLIIRFILKS